eukprot:CFRG0928T1
MSTLDFQVSKRTNRTQVPQKPLRKTANRTDTTSEPSAEEACILKAFDLNSSYGPCVGITRRERWIRAQKFGKTPDPAILGILDRYSENNKLVHQSLWTGIIP